MIAAPCAPSACHGFENGHAMRQPALIARPVPAPYKAPATVGRVASEFRNTQLKNRTRIPPATVLPIPQPKPMIHRESRSISLTCGGRHTSGAVAGLDHDSGYELRTSVGRHFRPVERLQLTHSACVVLVLVRTHAAEPLPWNQQLKIPSASFCTVFVPMRSTSAAQLTVSVIKAR